VSEFNCRNKYSSKTSNILWKVSKTLELFLFSIVVKFALVVTFCPTEECWCEGPEQDENHKDEKMENNAFYFMTKLG
jgi:hypothetical protein